MKGLTTVGKQRKFTKPEWMSFKWIKHNIDISIIMLIAFIGAISFFVGWASEIDWKKASEEDWNHLYQQSEAIKDFETYVDDDTVMEIKLESEECILILKKDKDNQGVEIIERDKANSAIGVIGGITIMAVFSVILWYVIIFVEIAVISIVIVFWPKKLKQKRGS